MDANKTKNTLDHWISVKFVIFFESLFVGLFSGGVVVLYRFLLSKAEVIRTAVYAAAKQGNFTLIALWTLFLIIAGLVIAVIIKYVPMVKGSGIPQVKGVLLHQLNMQWWKELIAKFLGGVLSLGAGLSLGREGPSIQLGAHIGMGISKTMKRPVNEQRYLITCGASAGLSAAFNAPLAGVMFSLEEMHKNFSPIVLVSAMLSSLAADFVSQKFFGQQPIFNFKGVSTLPFSYYIHLFILGAILGALGALFNKCLILTQDLYDRIRFLKNEYKVFVPIIIAAILGFILPQVLGGGNDLITNIYKNNPGIAMLTILILGKFFFTMISYGSGAPGGIFLPLLAIGALVGKLYAVVGINFLGINSTYAVNFIIFAMAAYFTAIVKAPITGSILITEMTGSFNHLLALITISIVAYMVAEVLKSKPVYDMLLGRILKNCGKDGFMPEEKNKALIEIAVSLGSEAENKSICNIVWPKQCLLVSVKRGDSEIIPQGNTVLYFGDLITVLTNDSAAPKVKKRLERLCREKI